ncbi:hypothetical protein FOVSG1_003626 [Fusarium oxysporum f. sp. vasinfectum]
MSLRLQAVEDQGGPGGDDRHLELRTTGRFEFHQTAENRSSQFTHRTLRSDSYPAQSIQNFGSFRELFGHFFSL